MLAVTSAWTPPTTQLASFPSPTRLSCPPMMIFGADNKAEEEKEAARQERLKQLFGDGFNDAEQRELARTTAVAQTPKPEPLPEWVEPAGAAVTDRGYEANRLMLWLEDKGCSMENIIVVQQKGSNKLALVTSQPVKAGDTLFEVPDSAVITSEAAFADPDVGRDLRIMAAKLQTTDDRKGFETFALGAMLAAERVRRGAIRGTLRRQDGGLQVGLLNFDRDGTKGELLPDWQVAKPKTLQTNRPYSPYINALDWPEEEEECRVAPERARAVEEGSKLIAGMIEPAARNAWMKNTQGVGLAQATSIEDCSCSAMHGLLLAIETQLDPPPPLGNPSGAKRWGGAVRDGPALCPLCDLVLPPEDAEVDELRESGAFNALLGRPSTGRVDVAIRCVAAADLPAGAVILSDAPGTAATVPGLVPIAPSSRVSVVAGALTGRQGKVITLKEGKPVVRLEGGDERLVVLPASSVIVIEAAESKKDDGKRRSVM